MEKKYDPDIFVEQFPLVKQFLYHIVYFREIKKAHVATKLESWFWTYTINAHLLQATMKWCMVFGADGCNQTHWKKLSKEGRKELQASFRKRLQDVSDLSSESWKECWSEMTQFRNKYVAHRELKYDRPVPDLSSAIKVALFYDRWIREVIAPDVLQDNPLEEFVAELQAAIAPLIRKLLTVTEAYNKSTEQQL